MPQPRSGEAFPIRKHMCVCACVMCVTDNSGILPIQHVDAIVARSFAQLAAVAVKKHALESDPLLVSE